MAELTAPPAIAQPGRWRRFIQSDLLYSFRHSPVTVAAAVVAVLIVASALLAPLIAPHNPFDLASLSLMDATDPPAWLKDGNWSYPLGTDDQGRDVLSTILYGTRLSLVGRGFGRAPVDAAGGDARSRRGLARRLGRAR